MKCSFCSSELKKGTGKMIVALDGRVSYFCSTKCERNTKIRNPRKVAWTDIHRKEKGKD